jgi:hypothetical protein
MARAMVSMVTDTPVDPRHLAQIGLYPVLGMKGALREDLKKNFLQPIDKEFTVGFYLICATAPTAGEEMFCNGKPHTESLTDCEVCIFMRTCFTLLEVLLHLRN